MPVTRRLSLIVRVEVNSWVWGRRLLIFIASHYKNSFKVWSFHQFYTSWYPSAEFAMHLFLLSASCELIPFS